MPNRLPPNFLELQQPIQVDRTSQTLHIGGEIIALATEPRIICDMRPGVQGIPLITRQFEDITRGQEPFRYQSMTNSLFTGVLLESYWRMLVGDRNFEERIQHTYFSQESSGLVGLGEAVESLREEGVATNVDVVLADKMSLYPADEVEEGIRGSYHLLRPGGSLVLQEVVGLLSNKFQRSQTTIQQLLEIAGDAGFDIGRQGGVREVEQGGRTRHLALLTK